MKGKCHNVLDDVVTADCIVALTVSIITRLGLKIVKEIYFRSDHR